jgi:hypothetical protein
MHDYPSNPGFANRGAVAPTPNDLEVLSSFHPFRTTFGPNVG